MLNSGACVKDLGPLIRWYGGAVIAGCFIVCTRSENFFLVLPFTLNVEHPV